MNNTNTNTNLDSNTTTNQENTMFNEAEVEVNLNEEQTMEKEASIGLKEQAVLLSKLAKESARQAESIQKQIALMEALKKAKTSGERDAAIAALAAKVATATVKTVKAIEKGAVIGTGYTMQYSGVALKVTSEQGVKLGSVMEAKGKQWANSYSDKLILAAREQAAEIAAAKNKK